MNAMQCVSYTHGLTWKYVRGLIRKGAVKIQGRLITDPLEEVKKPAGTLLVEVGVDQRTIL